MVKNRDRDRRNWSILIQFRWFWSVDGHASRADASSFQKRLNVSVWSTSQNGWQASQNGWQAVWCVKKVFPRVFYILWPIMRILVENGAQFHLFSKNNAHRVMKNSPRRRETVEFHHAILLFRNPPTGKWIRRSGHSTFSAKRIAILVPNVSDYVEVKNW